MIGAVNRRKTSQYHINNIHAGHARGDRRGDRKHNFKNN